MSEGCPQLFQRIETLELVMSIDEFVGMKSNFPPVDSYFQPRQSRLFLNLVQYSIGEVVNTKYPNDFPIQWIVDLFAVQKVQRFSIHYFDSNTTFDDLDKLFHQMPALLELDLSFGKLGFENVVMSVPFKKNDFHIQTKVDKSFFEAY